jgi:hypothetical protein
VSDIGQGDSPLTTGTQPADDVRLTTAQVFRFMEEATRPLVDRIATLELVDRERIAALGGENKVLRDRLRRCREYVPDNTWLADEIDSLTAHFDGADNA